jgi:serine/threonine-protein kinase
MIDLGQTVGNYRVIAKLGEGGMGAVFLAEHPVIGRRAALKVIHPQHARNAEVVARFVNEATAISRIGHEHIVEVTDFGRTPAGDFYFIMEHLDGEPLSALLAREAPLPTARALSIAAQIADALQSSHAHGVIHRDVKPENVFLVSRAGDPTFVKVLDFGLAKLVHGTGAAVPESRAGTVMGTPHYMSPEQCRGGAEIDHRSDVYALGVVLYEMLTGKLPFAGEAYGEVLLKQVTMQPPSARTFVPDLPEALELVIMRALAKDPAERFATMAGLRAALLAVGRAGHANVRATLHGGLPRHVLAAPSRTAFATPPLAAPEPRRSTTLEHSAGQLDDDPSLDRVPRNQKGRAFALATVAVLGGMALAAGVTRDDDAPLPAAPPAPVAAAPGLVPVSFSSDPDGATVLGADGETLGTTPLTIQLPRADAPAAFFFRKDGFEAKSMSLIPNVPSSMFALLRPVERPAERAGALAATPAAYDDDPPLVEPEAADGPHRRRADRVPERAGGGRRADLDGDGVLTPASLR